MAADYVLQALEARHEDLTRKLKARENAGPAYAENVAEIKLALATLAEEIQARKG